MKKLLLLAAVMCARFCGLDGRRDFANIATGIHADGIITRAAENPFTLRYLLCKKGTADDEIDINAADEEPMGICEDEPSAGDVSRVALLRSAPGTRIMVASGVIPVDDGVLTDAAGKVQAESTAAAGDYFRVGKALTASGADEDELEVDPQPPVAVTIA